MSNNLFRFPGIVVVLAWLVTSAYAQSIDPSIYYKLSTDFRGPGNETRCV